MGEQKSSSNNRWNWEVSGFEPRRTSPSSPEELPRASVAPLMRRYSISAASLASPFSSDFSKQALASKVLRLKDKVKVTVCSASDWGSLRVISVLAGSLFRWSLRSRFSLSM